MTPSRLLRSLIASAVLVVAASVLTAPVAHADHAYEEERGPGPVHAGNTYGWWYAGGLRWREEFETGDLDPERWLVEGAGVAQHQHGMLTLNSATAGSLSTTLQLPGRATGRWEIRMRSRRFSRGDANFQVVTELTPSAARNEACGARDIALESYRFGRSTARFHARNVPDLEFRGTVADLALEDSWHTWAVEVTTERISWFLDAHVVRTEQRSEALSGVRLTPRFTLRAPEGVVMNQGRMQVDWLRHWSLAAPNLLSVDAPPTRVASYSGAC